MATHEYLAWMAANTPSRWCNDSALTDTLEAALVSGAVGVTTNPPLTYEALTTEPELYAAALAELDPMLLGDDRVVQLLGLVVKRIAARLRSVWESSEHRLGYVRCQVQPEAYADYDAMLRQGLTIAGFGENVMVKIPGSDAGIAVLEELAARGIPTNPTVCVSVAQTLAAAEACDLGRARAREAGIPAQRSSAAFVMGRLQDYLSLLNEERGTGLSFDDLATAALAAAKRCYFFLRERGSETMLMPAAFRAARQVTELAGAEVEMTIHPKIQRQLNEWDAQGGIPRETRIDAAVDEAAVERVAAALPEFGSAYEPDGLHVGQFDAFGATQLTLDGFQKGGWVPLRESFATLAKA